MTKNSSSVPNCSADEVRTCMNCVRDAAIRMPPSSPAASLMAAVDKRCFLLCLIDYLTEHRTSFESVLDRDGFVGSENIMAVAGQLMPRARWNNLGTVVLIFSLLTYPVVIGQVRTADRATVQQPSDRALVSGTTGTFDSHLGYPVVRYMNGLQRRWVVTVPVGQRAQMTINMVDPTAFGMRSYDFAVMFDGNLMQSLNQACNIAAYQRLGKGGVQYQSVVSSSRSSARTFISPSNVAVLDFCVNSYFSGSTDPAMVGFRCAWTAFSVQPAPPPSTPVTPTPPPSPTTTTTTTVKSTAPTTASSVSPVRCGIPQNAPSVAMQRIVGGVNAPPNSWPWACALITSGKQFCDCSILQSSWVVTAGHCTASFTEAHMIQNVQVYYGSQYLPTAKQSKITRAIRNPNYEATTTSNDVALLKLATPITIWDSTTMPVCLPAQALDTFTPELAGSDGRSMAFVAGWGTSAYGAAISSTTIGSGSDTLLQVTIEMFNRADCVRSYGATFPQTSLCGGLNQGGRDSCQGDSGGPLVALQPANKDNPSPSYALFGIVSFGIGCALPGYPGAYSDVFQMKNFILTTMAQN